MCRRRLAYLATARLPVALLGDTGDADASAAGNAIQANQIHGMQNQVLRGDVHRQPLRQAVPRKLSSAHK